MNFPQTHDIQSVPTTGLGDACSVTSEDSPGITEALDVLAYVNGQPFVDVPKDLYIPPEALEVILDAFEGPLDLLLYLIRKNNLDVLDIPVAEVTRQYMEYVAIMKQFRLELAADYLVMAALLSELKSRCLLPRHHVEEDEEVDPRQELIRRLQEYERFKTAAEAIDGMPRVDRDIHPVTIKPPNRVRQPEYPDVGLNELLLAFREVLLRSNLTEHHQVEREKLSTRERMSRVLEQLRHKEYVLFVELFEAHEGRGGVVVSFLAMLELLKEGLIEAVQHEPFGAIYVAARTRVREIDASLNQRLANLLADHHDVDPVQSNAAVGESEINEASNEAMRDVSEALPSGMTVLAVTEGATAEGSAVLSQTVFNADHVPPSDRVKESVTDDCM